MTGRVVSIKSKNTATVLVSRVAMHPLYKKTYVQSKKYLVDDSLGVDLGDIVDIINCKPISKRKTWKITKVLGRNFTEIAKESMMEKAEEAIAEVMPEESEKNTEEISENKVEMDNSTKKPKSKKGGKDRIVQIKHGTA